MPAAWYDYGANSLGDDPTEEDIAKREFNLRILANKKPYFMRYIYDTLRKEYNTFIRNVNIKCLREFRIDVEEMEALGEEGRSDRQNEFMSYMNNRFPVSNNNCVMNKICRRFEEEFDGYIKRHDSNRVFDLAIIHTDDSYTDQQKAALSRVYRRYCDNMKSFSQLKRSKDNTAYNNDLSLASQLCREKCYTFCNSKRVLVNLMLDTYYKNIGTQKFVWDLIGRDIVDVLVERNGGMLSFPVEDPDGDICYGGEHYSMRTIRSELYGYNIE